MALLTLVSMPVSYGTSYICFNANEL
jgi:hypothetical protein